MYNFVLMDVLQPKAYLNEPLKNLVFTELVDKVLEGSIKFALTGNTGLQITTFSVLHNDAYVLILVEEALTVCNDILMSQRLHDLDFAHNILLLL
jgi:hypothetical protein